MAERTIHIEGDSIQRETEAAIRATEIQLAERRGFRRAIEALRNEAAAAHGLLGDVPTVVVSDGS